MKTRLLDIYISDMAQWRTYAFPSEMNWEGIIRMLCRLINDEFPQLRLDHEKIKIVSMELRVVLILV